MIDKDFAKNRFKEIETEYLLRVIEVTIIEFSKRINLILKNTKDQFYQQTKYHSHHIRESYAFIFNDVELNNLCLRIEEAIDTNEKEIIKDLVKELNDYAPIFIKDLNLFSKELKSK